MIKINEEQMKVVVYINTAYVDGVYLEDTPNGLCLVIGVLNQNVKMYYENGDGADLRRRFFEIICDNIKTGKITSDEAVINKLEKGKLKDIGMIRLEMFENEDDKLSTFVKYFDLELTEIHAFNGQATFQNLKDELDKFVTTTINLNVLWKENEDVKDN